MKARNSKKPNKTFFLVSLDTPDNSALDCAMGGEDSAAELEYVEWNVFDQYSVSVLLISVDSAFIPICVVVSAFAWNFRREGV